MYIVIATIEIILISFPKSIEVIVEMHTSAHIILHLMITPIVNSTF